MALRKQVWRMAELTAALAGVVAIGSGGCGRHKPGDGDDLATVTVAITQAPADAACARIAATGTMTRSLSVGLTPGQDTTFAMGALPTGTVVFSAEAFDGACDALGTNTYSSDLVTMTLKPGNNGLVTLHMRPNAGARVALDFPGDGTNRKWVSFDASPAGTPADLGVQPGSDANRTLIQVTVHGLWTEPKMGPDGKSYTALDIPGLGTMGQVGAPALPVARAQIALATDARAAVLEGVSVMASKTIPGTLVWPQGIPEKDQSAPPPPSNVPGGTAAPGASPEQFQRDEKIYGGQGLFPPAAGGVLGARQAMLGSVDGTVVAMSPVRWNPADGSLVVALQSLYTFTHTGVISPRDPMTKDNGFAAEATFVNWGAVGVHFPIQILHYFGRFLFVYPPGYRDALLPLINQKAARGFAVTEMTTATTGTSCAGVRTAIQGWYAGGLPSFDHYAILVGDVNQIDTCTGFYGDPGDDLYGTTDSATDLAKEVHLGRLSVDSTTDLANQVEKILRYEDHPSLLFDYGRALLVAHLQEAPGKYVGAQESVRTAAYAVPPTFSTLYGHVGSVDNSDVINAINDGQGIVAYRGHGDVGEWWSWNTLGQSFFNSDVASVANLPTRVPIVWSIACLNNNLSTSDSIGETWMKNPDNRAVAHYGATEPSATVANHELDRRLFKAVFGLGITTHSRAIEYAETQMVLTNGAAGEGNAWMYLLLGDPEMRIRRGPVLSLVVATPVAVSICGGANCPPFDVTVKDPTGLAVPGALVSLWKDGEIFDNAYTNDAGGVSIPVAVKSGGEVIATVRSDRGEPIGTFTVPVR